MPPSTHMESQRKKIKSTQSPQHALLFFHTRVTRGPPILVATTHCPAQRQEGAGSPQPWAEQKAHTSACKPWCPAYTHLYTPRGIYIPTDIHLFPSLHALLGLCSAAEGLGTYPHL